MDSNSAVLMSINYKWCKLIQNGNKSIEVRKSAPKLNTPYKVYMYCTKDGPSDDPIVGHVFGEFTCSDTIKFEYGKSYSEDKCCIAIALGARISPVDMYAYAKGKTASGLMIRDLKIYDEPKKLSDFANLSGLPVSKAPMNYLYVNELSDENV